MKLSAPKRMELFLQRCHREGILNSTFRSVLLVTSLFLVLAVSIYPGLRSLVIHLHAVLTGSYTPGHHSVLLINSPNEQAAKDISRAVMERHLAASVNIFSKTATLYYWKGEIQDATETLIVSFTMIMYSGLVIQTTSFLLSLQLVRTKTSRIQHVIDFVRSIHPYSNPEILSFSVEGGSLAYMKWMDEAVPND